MAEREGHPGYALEKLRVAAYFLAIGEGDVRSRLKEAYRHMTAVFPRDIPASLRPEFEEIVRSLTKHPKRHEQDSALDHTLSRMRNRTGSKIAQRILNLKSDLEGHLEDLRCTQ